MSKVKPKASKRVAIVVAGMHRSGTSALTKVLSAFGYQLPNTLLAAADSNEAGFWESPAINRLNDKIFQTADATWRSWQALPADWSNAPNIDALKNEALATLHSEFGAKSSLILKDPRLCRLMQFWLPVLEEFGTQPVVVCPIRNPLETAASLEKRNKLPQPLDLMIWLRYQLDVEFHTRGRPRSFTNYNGLLIDWRRVVHKIMAETRLKSPGIDDETANELTAWLSPTLRHHQVADAAALHDTAVPEWVRSAYAIFLKWSETREDKKDFTQLDRIRNEVNSIPDSLRGILDSGEKHITGALGLRKKIETLEAELVNQTRQREVHNAEAKVYVEQFTRAQSSAEDSLQRLAQRDAAAALAMEQLQEKKSQLESVHQQKAELSRQLNEYILKQATLEHELQGAVKLRLDLEKRNEEAQQQLEHKDIESKRHLTQLADDRQRLAERAIRIEEFQLRLGTQDATLADRDKKLEQLEHLHSETLRQLAQNEVEAKLSAERSIDREKNLEIQRSHSDDLRRQITAKDALLLDRDKKLEQLERLHGETLVQLEQKDAEARLISERAVDREKTLEVLRSRFDDLLQQIAAKNALLADRDKKIDQLERLHGETRGLLVQKDTEARLYAEHSVKREKKLEVLHNRTEELLRQVAAKDALLADREKKFKQLERLHGETLRHLEKKNTEIKLYAERSADDLNKLKVLNSRTDNLLRQVAMKDAMIADRDNKIDQTLRLNGELSRLIANKDDEARHYEERLVERANMLVALGHTTTELHRQLEVKNAAFTHLDQKLGQLSRSHTDAQRQLAQNVVALSNAHGQIGKVNDELKSVKNQHKEFVQEIENRNSVLSKEVGALKNKLFVARNKRDKALQERDKANHEIVRLEKKLNAIRQSRLWKIRMSSVAIYSGIEGLFRSTTKIKQRNLVEIISTSPLFDSAWYLEKYPDVAIKKADPVLHYLLFGANERRDPGPAFKTEFYLNRYPDVARDGTNPLIHYEKFGRLEQRQTLPAEIAARSSYVNAALHRESATLPVVPSARQKPAKAAETALVSGAGFPVFSMPLGQADANITWLSLADLLRLSNDFLIEFGGLVLAQLGRTTAPARRSINSILVEPVAARSPLDSRRVSRLQASSGHIHKAPDIAIPPGARNSIETFARLTFMPETHALRLRKGDTIHTLPHAGPFSATACNLHTFKEIPVETDAIWYTSDRDLRIRFSAERVPDGIKPVVRGYQCDPSAVGGLVMVGEQGIEHTSIQTVDFALINPYLPVLLTLTTPDARFIDASLLPFPSLFPGGAHEAEPFASNQIGAGDLAVLSRSLLAEHLRASNDVEGWALSRIMFDIREATSAERIFSTDVKEWLWSIFAMKLEAWRMPELDRAAMAHWNKVFAIPDSMQDKACLERHTARSRQGLEMICPPSAIPSIHALTACRADGGMDRTCSVGAYVIAQQGGGTRWLVEMPHGACEPERSLAMTGSVRHPFINRTSNVSAGGIWRTGAPIAVLQRDLRPRHSCHLIMPIAPEIKTPLLAVNAPEMTGKVSVVFTTSNVTGEASAALLESLTLQRGVEVVEIIVAMVLQEDNSAFTAALQRYFPKRYRLLECAADEDYVVRVQRASELIEENGDNACVLFINRAVVLHDPRTLDTLVRLSRMDKVASVGCMLIGANSSSPTHPVQVLFSGVLPLREQVASQTECVEFDAQALFPLDVYPVASNGDALFMMRANVWRTIGGFQVTQYKDRRAAIELSAALAERGMTHQFTTRVSAEVHAAQPTAHPARWMPSEHAAQALHAVSTCIEVLPL